MASLPAGTQDRLGAEKGLSWLEDRVQWLERRLDNPTKDFPVEVASQLQVIRSKMVDECTSRFSRGFNEIQIGLDEVRNRVDAFDRWVQDVVSVEMVAVRMDLDKERRTREDTTAELLRLLQQYSALVQKNADPRLLEKESAWGVSSVAAASTPRGGRKGFSTTEEDY